jgi:hypothetical protein
MWGVAKLLMRGNDLPGFVEKARIELMERYYFRMHRWILPCLFLVLIVSGQAQDAFPEAPLL